jgi:ATP-binding cassette subfamily F protein 3
VLEELTSVANTDDVPRLRGHLGAFLFSGDDVDKKVAVLSGGEKSRLALARMLLRPANFLVLDEPTNHLDLAACEVLEEALAGYAGTLLMISHDRDFISATATRVIEVREGRLLESRAEREGSAAARDSELPELPELPRAPGLPPSKQERMLARERAQREARERARAERRAAALEIEIGDLEVEIANAERRLGMPEVYRDGGAVRETESRLRALRADLDSRYSEWESLAQSLEADDGDSEDELD